MKHPKYQIFQSAINQKFYFRLSAPDGSPILVSNSYADKHAAILGIETVKANAPFPDSYERRDDVHIFSFNLKAVQGHIIGHSEIYATASMREQALQLVKAHAHTSMVEDIHAW